MNRQKEFEILNERCMEAMSVGRTSFEIILVPIEPATLQKKLSGGQTLHDLGWDISDLRKRFYEVPYLRRFRKARNRKFTGEFGEYEFACTTNIWTKLLFTVNGDDVGMMLHSQEASQVEQWEESRLSVPDRAFLNFCDFAGDVIHPPQKQINQAERTAWLREMGRHLWLFVRPDCRSGYGRVAESLWRVSRDTIHSIATDPSSKRRTKNPQKSKKRGIEVEHVLRDKTEPEMMEMADDWIKNGKAMYGNSYMAYLTKNGYPKADEDTKEAFEGIVRRRKKQLKDEKSKRLKR